MIPLVCGDPTLKPASYTRFVLPFAYSPIPWSGSQGPAVFQPTPPAPSVDMWRRQYLTAETAAVLFGRAGWFQLKGVEPFSFAIHRNTRAITVRVDPPSLVLFEWSGQPVGGQQGGRGDPLQVGFLVVEASFPQKAPPDFDDLLDFNEKFRYWQRPYEGHEDGGYRQLLADCPIDIQAPERCVRDGDIPDIYLRRWTSWLTSPIEDSNGKRWRLFPERSEKQARTWANSERSLWDSGWIVYSDPRAFVWTCAIVKQGGKALAEAFPVSRLDASAFGHWIKLLNVDEPCRTPRDTHESTEFERDWARKRTYRRWEEQGTFYGFNYHCGAMLGPPSKPPEAPPLWHHFGHMYFDQTLLLLYLRVVSFSFSRQLSCISAQARDIRAADEKAGFEEWRRAFQDLRWDFALFTNLYEFPLLSNHQQGLEMYEKARESMDVGQLFREIQEEIRSSHEYLEIRAEQEQTQMAIHLTVVATAGLVLGLSTSFLGMNVIVEGLRGDPTKLKSDSFVFIIVLVICLSLLAFCLNHSKCILDFFDWLTKLPSSEDMRDKAKKP